RDGPRADFNPVVAAKEMVTADHVGEGRFGLNIVVGWNEGEFEMFGVEQRGHQERYHYAQEWIDVIKMIWSDRGLRLPRQISHHERYSRQAETLWRHPPIDHERGGVSNRARFRSEEL